MTELIRSIQGPYFLLYYFWYTAFLLIVMFHVKKVNDIKSNNKMISVNDLSTLELIVLRFETDYREILNFFIMNLYNKKALKLKNKDQQAVLKRNKKYKGELDKHETIILEFFSTERTVSETNDKSLLALVKVFAKETSQKLIKYHLMKNKRVKIFERNNHLLFSIVILAPGILKTLLGLKYQKPVVFIIFMVISILLALILIYKNKSEKTILGKKAIKELAKQVKPHKGNELDVENPLLVSLLWGTGYLAVYPEYAAFSDMFYSAGDYGSNVDSSSCSDCSDCSSCSSCGGCGGD